MWPMWTVSMELIRTWVPSYKKTFNHFLSNHSLNDVSVACLTLQLILSVGFLYTVKVCMNFASSNTSPKCINPIGFKSCPIIECMDSACMFHKVWGFFSLVQHVKDTQLLLAPVSYKSIWLVPATLQWKFAFLLLLLQICMASIGVQGKVGATCNVCK